MKFSRIIIFIGVLGFILSLAPFLLNISVPVTPGRVNPHWDNWPYDFNYYRSIITQGKNGQTKVYDKYTSENQSGSFLRIGYLALGHLAKNFNLNETFTYHLARIILGGIFIVTTYYIIRTSFEKEKLIIIIVFILCLFFPGYPEIICNPNCHLAPRLWSMTQLDPIRRLTFLPHFLWGQIAFILVILSLINNSIKIKWLILFCMFLGIAGLDHPSSLLLLIPVLGLTTLSMIWKNYLTKKIFFKFILVSFMLAPFIVYLYLASNSFPWVMSRQAEFTLEADFWRFALTMGPTYIIGLMTAILVYFSKKRLPLIIIINASWLIAITLLTFIFHDLFDYSQTRFLQVAPQIPASILTGYLITHSLNFRKKIIIYAVVLFLIFIPTLSTLFVMYYDQIDYEIYFAKNSLPNIPYPPYIDYPPKEWMEGFDWLKINSKPSEIVLSDFTAGNFVPTYGGNTVFYGHKTETYDSEKKREAIEDFFQTNDYKKQELFLITNRISYIFFGPQEKAYGDSSLKIPNTKIVFKNSMVIIYKYLKMR